MPSLREARALQEEAVWTYDLDPDSTRCIARHPMQPATSTRRTSVKNEADHDKAQYLARTHVEFIELTRALWRIPFGDLSRLHKEKARELGATSPTTVFVRAILFARLVAAQEKYGDPA